MFKNMEWRTFETVHGSEQECFCGAGCGPHPVPLRAKACIAGNDIVPTSAEFDVLQRVFVFIALLLRFLSGRIKFLADELEQTSEGADRVFLGTCPCEGNIDDPRRCGRGERGKRYDEVFDQAGLLLRGHDHRDLFEDGIREGIRNIELEDDMFGEYMLDTGDLILGLALRELCRSSTAVEDLAIRRKFGHCCQLLHISRLGFRRSGKYWCR